jgi:hypothetical protein
LKVFPRDRRNYLLPGQDALTIRTGEIDFLIMMITMSIQVLFMPIFSVAIWIVTLEPQGDNIGRRRHCAEFLQDVWISQLCELAKVEAKREKRR